MDMKMNDMKIGRRLNLILGLVMAGIIIALGLYTLNMQKNKIIADTDVRMNEQVEDLVRIIDIQVQENQVNASRALDLANSLLNAQGGLHFVGASDKESDKDAGWYIDNQNITQNSSYVDEIGRLTGAIVTVFKKTENGFQRISTTVKNEDGQREIGTVINNTSEVAQAISNGQLYNGRAIVINDWCLTSYSPLRLNGEVVGMLGVGLKEKDMVGLRGIFMDKKYFASGYPFMIDKTGVMVIHPSKEGVDLSKAQFFQQLSDSNSKTGKTKYLWEGNMKFQYFKYVDSVESYVCVSIYEHELMGIINQVRLALLIAIILGIGLFVLINSMIVKSITKVLNKGVEFAEQIAQGNLNLTMDVNQKDEVGQLASSLNNMVVTLRDIVTGITTGSNNIAAASEQMSSTSQQISQGAAEQASSSEEVSSSIEEMSSNIQQNTDNANQTEKISQNAALGIENVSAAAEQSLSSVREISGKIQIINDIAFQTNILALNAAVEAARAGEHGKGFAVVAAEVRKLAERSKVAADEIVELSVSSRQTTEHAGELMEKLIPEIQKTSKLVQEISAASNEQNSGANQVNSAINQLSQVTQQNASASEEMATSSEELASQAEQLKDLISFFKVNGVSTNKSSVISKSPLYNVNSTPFHSNGSSNGSMNGSTNGVALKMYEESTSDNEYEKF